MASTDYLTITGAERLASIIRAYWAHRGFDVQTRLEPLIAPSGHQVLGSVRSNLINGAPAGFKPPK